MTSKQSITSSSVDTSANHSINHSSQLVFLVGPPRSGSSWLQKILGTHQDIGTVQESHLFNHFLGPVLDAWDHLVSFDDGRGGIGLPAYMDQRKFDELIANFSVSAFSQVPEYDNTIFLEKTPDHIRHIDHIQRVFPDSKIILLLRHPEDVIESMLSAGESWGKNWAPKSTIKAIRQYRYFFSKFNNELLEKPDPTLHICRYEDLKKNPQPVVTEILRFLNLECGEKTVTRLIDNPISLNKYGEFSTQGRTEVTEPVGFARPKKEKLNILQKLLISTCLWQHKRAIGY